MNGRTLHAGAAGTVTLGDLTVNRLGFGAMRLTGRGVWGPPADRDNALAVLRRAVELGVNLIDTADSYGPHVDEELIAQALHPYPAGLVIATKAGWQRPGPGQWVPDGRPEHLREAVHGSLRRLKLDRIDLLQFHTPDEKVPFEDSVGALAELQRAGAIRHVGLSNVDVDQIERARRITAIVSVQNRLAADGSDDDEERDVLAYCERSRIAYLPWAPLGGGSLRAAAFAHIARKHGATVNQVALAHLLRRSPVITPIPGTSSLAHLEENVAAASLTLSAEDVAELAPGGASATNIGSDDVARSDDDRHRS
jgi:pyridoxine 4-dehydrogenase